MLDFTPTIHLPQIYRKRKHSSAAHLPIRRLRAIAGFFKPFMGFKPNQTALLDGEPSRKQPASNGKMSRTSQNRPEMTRTIHSSVPTTPESSITRVQPTVEMPDIPPAKPRNRGSLESYHKSDYSSEVRRTVYPGGRTKTEMIFSLSGRPLNSPKASTRTSPSGRRVSWKESITRKESRITKISKPTLIRVNEKNRRVNEISKTNVLSRRKHRYGRSVKPSALALSFCAAVLAFGGLGIYTVASLDMEIQQLRALKQHQEIAISLLKNRLDHVQRVVDEELVGSNSTISVLVRISNVLSWAVGNIAG